MPYDPPDRSRRAYLLALAGGGVGLAGCSEEDSDGTTRSTDRRTGTTSVPRTSDRETTEPTPAVVRFDGGGLSAFAAALDDLRETTGGELRLSAGTYRFDSSRAPEFEYPRDDDRVHFDGAGLDGVTIAGPSPDSDGVAEIVLEDPTRGFVSFANENGATAADRPSGPTVRDLTVRHDPVPFTQGEIVQLSPDRRSITLRLEPDFPHVDRPPFTTPEPLVVSASVFTAAGERIARVTETARSNFKRFEAIERTGPREASLRLAEGIEPGGLAVGRRLALIPRHRNATQFHHRDRTDPTYERVRLHTSPNFAFQFDACDRPVVRNCRIEPPPGTGALIGTNADGVHCNNCPRGPKVTGCTFHRTSDDAVVADAELLAVESFLADDRVRVFAGLGTRVGAGDRLEAASPGLHRFGTLPPVEAVDQRGGGVTSAAVNPESIRFSEPVRDTLSVGDILLGPRMHNRETVVRNCVVSGIRARFVRFGGVDGGVIEDNTFRGTNADGVEVMAAGDVRPSVSDLKGWSSDIRIRNNELVDVGLVGVPSGVPRGIVLGVERADDPAADGNPSRPHRRVRLTNNAIRNVGGHGVEVADAERVTVRANRIESAGQIPGTDRGRYGLGVRNVGGARVVGNTVVAPEDGLLGFGWIDRSTVETSADNSYVVGGREQGATLTDLG